MGSDRGQTRRARGAVATMANQRPGKVLALESVAVAEGKQRWAEFVLDSGIQKTGMHEYYLGHTFSRRVGAQKIITDYRKLVAELFADMVLVGALSLPNSRSAEDFRFTVKTKDVSFRYDTHMFRKDKPNVQVRLLSSSRHLYPNMLMGEPYVYSYLEGFQDCIDALVKQLN